MAEEKGGGGGGFDPWILIFVVLIFSALFARGDSGGGLFGNNGIKYGSPSGNGTVEEEIRNESRQNSGWFFTPSPTPAPTPAPSGNGQTSTKNLPIVAPTKDNIWMQGYGSTKLSYSQEYIQIYTPYQNQGRVNISGIKFRNKNNEIMTIGADESGFAILLNPGEYAIVSTGVSPRGFSFKLNKCSGYLAQSQNYYPSISNYCPYISDLPQVRDLSDRCEKYLNSIFTCTTPIINYQTGIDEKCAAFVEKHANYPGCVADYKNDKDFDKKEWRVFMGRSSEFWNNNHEDIQMYSPSGDLISSSSY